MHYCSSWQCKLAHYRERGDSGNVATPCPGSNIPVYKLQYLHASLFLILSHEKRSEGADPAPQMKSAVRNCGTLHSIICHTKIGVNGSQNLKLIRDSCSEERQALHVHWSAGSLQFIHTSQGCKTKNKLLTANKKSSVWEPDSWSVMDFLLASIRHIDPKPMAMPGLHQSCCSLISPASKPVGSPIRGRSLKTVIMGWKREIWPNCNETRQASLHWLA